MKFLRNESGQIVLPRTPFSLWSKTAPTELRYTPPGPQPAVAAATPAPAVTSHCCFVCRWCGSPILLPHDRMGLPFANPSVRRIEVRTIATVCGSCHLVGNFSLFRGCPGFDTRHKLVPAPVAGTTLLVEWLKCDAPGCPFQVPLFVNFESGLSEDDKTRLSAKWIWQTLKCMSGHSIRRTAAPSHPPTD